MIGRDLWECNVKEASNALVLDIDLVYDACKLLLSGFVREQLLEVAGKAALSYNSLPSWCSHMLRNLSYSLRIYISLRSLQHGC